MWDRSQELERFTEELSRRLAHAEARIASAEQNVSKLWNNAGGGGGGGTGKAYWCKSPSGGIAAATSTWPTLSPASFTADVYQDVAGTLTLFSAGATVYWWFKDTDSGNRLIPCTANGDGSFDAVANSCTRVDV